MCLLGVVSNATVQALPDFQVSSLLLFGGLLGPSKCPRWLEAPIMGFLWFTLAGGTGTGALPGGGPNGGGAPLLRKSTDGRC